MKVSIPRISDEIEKVTKDPWKDCLDVAEYLKTVDAPAQAKLIASAGASVLTLLKAYVRVTGKPLEEITPLELAELVMDALPRTIGR